MILIHHESSENVLLHGTRASFEQIRAMVDNWLHQDADTLRIVAMSATADDEEPRPGFLRFRRDESPLKLKRLGKDLLIKGNAESMHAISAAFDLPPECQPGDGMQFDVETPGTEISSVIVCLAHP